MEDRNNEQVAEETVEQTEERSAENYSLLEKSGDFGKKVCANERKTNYIGNAILLLFSVIMFICCFFAGARVQLTVGYGIIDDTLTAPDEITCRQNTVEVLTGMFAFAMNKEERAVYLAEYNLAVEKAYNTAEKRLNETIKKDGLKKDNAKDIHKIGKLMGKYFSQEISASGINAVKANICLAMNNINSDSISSYITIFLGTGFSGISLILNLICMVGSLVLSIKTLVALIKKKSLESPFKSIKLMLTTSIGSFFLMVMNPFGSPTEALKAMFAASVITVALLCVYRSMVLEPWGTQNKMELIKYGALYLISLTAFLLLSGKIYGWTINLRGDQTLKLMLGAGTLFDNNLTGAFSGNIAGILLAFCWFCCFSAISLSVLGRLLLILGRKLCEGSDFFKKPLLLASAIESLVLLSLSVVMFIVINSVEKLNFFYPIAIGPCLIAAIVFCVGYIVVNGVLKVKTTENKQKSLINGDSIAENRIETEQKTRAKSADQTNA